VRSVGDGIGVTGELLLAAMFLEGCCTANCSLRAESSFLELVGARGKTAAGVLLEVPDFELRCFVLLVMLSWMCGS